MPGAITNTSPVLYLGRIGVLGWLEHLFGNVWIPAAVIDELAEGRVRGFDVPLVSGLPWLETVDPRSTPSEWLTLDLGAGELAADFDEAAWRDDRRNDSIVDDVTLADRADGAPRPPRAPIRKTLRGFEPGTT